MTKNRINSDSWGGRIQRNIVGELDEATLSLALAHHTPIQSVHDARRRLKRVRAGLRLLKAGGGKSTKANKKLHREDRVLAEAARSLGPIRDGHVTYLARPDSALPPPYSPKVAKIVMSAAVALTSSASRTSRWQPSDVDDRSVEARLDHSYRAAWHRWKTASAYLDHAHRAHANPASIKLSRSESRDGDDALHECRKAVKRLHYQLVLLAEVGFLADRDGAVGRRLTSLEELGDLLGAQHDLTFVGIGEPGTKDDIEMAVLDCGGSALGRTPKKHRTWVKQHR